jgi:hypothetical protein
MDYDDDYATCDETFATLRIYPGTIMPDEVTRELGIGPSSTEVEGQLRSRRQPPSRCNGWFLCSKGQITSRDSRRHIDWLLDRLLPVRDALLGLRDRGARMDVFCFWVSAHGHGGPMLSVKQMKGLVELDLECGYDMYYLGDDEDEA